MSRDDEFIDRVLSGETNAFSYFLKHYKDMAFNIAVSIIKDDQYAEEIVQDAFMKAFNALKSFNRSSKFKSWFYRIVVNESFQRLRKLKKEHSLLELTEVLEIDSDSSQEVQSEKSEQVVKLIKNLPANESLALNLFYLEENSLKDIVDITGWTLANVKVVLHRARKNIRVQLEKNIK